MSWSVWSGCKTKIVVIPDSQTEIFFHKGEHFEAPVDGVFMGNARYQRYRRAVADRILEQQ